MDPKSQTNVFSESKFTRGSLLKGILRGMFASFIAGAAPISFLSNTGKARSQTTSWNRTYKASSANFPNPERGFFVGIDPMQNDYYSDGKLVCRGNSTMPHKPPPEYAEKYEMTPQKLKEHRSNGITLIRKYYLLYDYRESYIPRSYLDEHIVHDLNLVRECGLKLIPRFIYVWNESYETGASRDASVTWISRHLDQLAPILKEHTDVISHLETGFVGWYGEWHNSTNRNIGGTWTDSHSGAQYGEGLNGNSITIINKVLNSLPSRRMYSLRYTHHLAQLHQDYFGGPFTESEAYGETNEARIGLEDSSVMYSDTHRGGYWPPTSDFGKQAKASMRAFQHEITRNVVMTGEPSGDDGSGYVFKSDPFVELGTMHWDAMNNCWYEAERDGVYDFWKDQGAYDEIGIRLGYRFSLLGASVTRNVAPSGPFRLTFDIKNSGFSSPYNKRLVEVLLRNTSNGYVYRLSSNADPRRWKSGQVNRISISGNIPDNMQNGQYDVLLNLPDPEPRLYGRSEYSIRLANENVWENSTGYNDLGLKVTISNSARSSTVEASGVSQTFKRANLQSRGSVPEEITILPVGKSNRQEASTTPGSSRTLKRGEVLVDFASRPNSPKSLQDKFAGIGWGKQRWTTRSMATGVKYLKIGSHQKSASLTFVLPKGKVLKRLDLLKLARSGKVNRIVISSSGNRNYEWANPAPWWATHDLDAIWNKASKVVKVTVYSDSANGVGNLGITNIVYGNP